MSSIENQQLVAKLRQNPVVASGPVTMAEQRAYFEKNMQPFPVADGVRIEAAQGVEADWFLAGGPADAAILYLHGGGFVIGSSLSHRGLVSNVAAASGIDSLCLNYRLAPEHPCPAAVEDAIAAYRWLRAAGRKSIAIVGDSAGCNIAAGLLVALRDAGEPMPACAAFISGWFDLALNCESLKRNAAADPLVTFEILSGMQQAYLQGMDPHDPRATAIFGELSGLPPLLFHAGTADILEDDSHTFAARARAAGVDVSLEAWPEMIHCWHVYAGMIPEARRAVDELGRYVKQHVRQ